MNCRINDCNSRVVCKEVCSRHYQQLRRRGELGASWKIKDTSNMGKHVPKTAFKKGVKTWNTGISNWLSEDHIKAIKKSNTKYSDVELLMNKQLRHRSRSTRRAVIRRDDGFCQICFLTTEYPQVDHIKSWKDYPELRFEIDNCRTLCMPCHYYVTYKRKLPTGQLWGHTKRRLI